MSRVQLALNVDDLDDAIAFYSKLFGTEPAKRPARLRQLRHRRPAPEAGPDREPRPGRLAQPPRRRGRRHRRRRRRAGPPRRRRARLRRRARHHLLLRQAGQVLGRGAPDGEPWEIYTVLADSPTFNEDDGDSTCCGSDPGRHLLLSEGWWSEPPTDKPRPVITTNATTMGGVDERSGQIRASARQAMKIGNVFEELFHRLRHRPRRC